MITTIERGGAENQLLVLVKGQVRAGNDVSVAYLKGRDQLSALLEEVGVRVIHKIANKPFLVQQTLLKRLIGKRYDILHAHLPRSELLCSIIRTNSKFIISKHNMEQFFPKSPKLISLLLSRFVVARAQQIIAISNAVSDYLYATREVPQSKCIHVIHYGYGFHVTEHALERRRFTNIIGTISRLAPQKDLVTLINAFALVASNNQNLTLKIYGEGSERASLERLSESLSLKERVRFMGKTDSVDEAMQEFELFILSSIYEGFGLVLLEAMSNNVPIICSNSVAAVEVLGSSHPLIFRIGDAKELAYKIEHAINQDLSEVLDHQKKRLEIFSPKLMLEKVMYVYQI